MSYNLFDPSSPAAAAAVAAVTSTQHTTPCTSHTCRDVTSSGVSRLKAIASVLFSIPSFLLSDLLPSSPHCLLTPSPGDLLSLSLSLSLHPSCLSTNRVACLELSMVLKERERECECEWERLCVCQSSPEGTTSARTMLSPTTLAVAKTLKRQLNMCVRFWRLKVKCYFSTKN